MAAVASRPTDIRKTNVKWPLLLVLVKSNLSLWVQVRLASRQKSVTDHPVPCQLSSGIEREAIFQVELGQQDGASKTGFRL
jgi:hypothetical protein